MKLALRHVYKRIEGLEVIRDLSLEVEEGRLACILGPSGAGKTTLLNLMAGITVPDSGEMEGFSGKRVSYLFQEPRLLKWKTVRGNLEFVLKDHMGPAERQRTIDRYLQMVGLTEFQHYLPAKLSGGMRQRVALARAFAFPSDLLLMDEPFTGLDVQLKLSLMQAFIDLWLADRRTTFFVTHNIQEAVMLGEEIFVLSDRPASVKGHIELSIPHRQRDGAMPELQRAERDLFRLLTLGTDATASPA
ncbi:MAG: ABC transporter ATP-binding protein [Syntrophomonadaceae bacterium]|nr:ABC transporter ATP-binding protein [Syntrophomonadaceae bacterium]